MRRWKYRTLIMPVLILGLAACGTAGVTGGATPASMPTEGNQRMASDQPGNTSAPLASNVTTVTAITMNASLSPTELPILAGTAEVAVAATAAPAQVTVSSDQRPPAAPTTEPEATAATNSAAEPSAQPTPVEQGAVTSIPLVATRAPIAPIGTEQLPEQPPITAEDGQVIHLKVGEIFQLNLNRESGWLVKIGDERIIAPVAVGAGADAQNSYKALAPGETTLTATRTPTCRQTKPPCMLPTIVLRIKIVVQ